MKVLPLWFLLPSPASISSKIADSCDVGDCAHLAVLKLPIGDIKLDMAERKSMFQCPPIQIRGSGMESRTDLNVFAS